MAVAYDEISYKYIEKGLKTIINDEFRNVYVSPLFKMRGTECIRIAIDSSENDETTNAYERRIFNVIVRYYQKGDLRSEKFDPTHQPTSSTQIKKVFGVESYILIKY